MHDPQTPLASSSAAQRAALLAAIEAYLAMHPDSADSAAGIAQWWLPACGVQAPVAQVELALSEGLNSGRLRRLQLPDGSVIWGAARPMNAEPKPAP